jgi:hypothetical protein
MSTLGYLINPALQIEDVNGKPLVGGTIRVFRHGTTIPYITWKDFTGDRNPATVVLDAKGMAILLAEPGYLYDVYCEDRHGVPQWSRLNVPVEAGGMGISSSDGSLVITQTDTGGGVVYDISVAHDGTELLEWCLSNGYTTSDLGMVPTISDGTMVAGDNGIRLAGGFYYHVTARVKATVGTLQPYYNEFDILFKGWTEDGSYTFLDRPVVIDGSMTSTQEWEISFDVMPSVDVELYVATEGLSYYNTVGLLDMEIHRVFSGTPRIPDGVASKPWIAENYQEKLTPGNGIEIDENNVISATAAQQQQADWTQTDTEAVDYIKNKPANLVQDADYVHTDNNFTDSDKSKLTGVESGAEVNVQANWNESDTSSDAYIQNKPANLVQDANYVHTDNNFTNADVTKLSGIASGAEVNVQPNWNETDTSSDAYIQNKPANLVQDAAYVHTDNNFTNADATKLSGIASGAEVNVQANWNESDSSSDAYIQNKPAIPSGSQLVPSATPSDAGEVLTVDSNGDPTWAPAQAPISAGNGIDITSNTVSAKVDGSTITFNASGEMVASGGGVVPPLKPVVAGPNITITENSSDIAISAVIPVVPVIGTITL